MYLSDHKGLKVPEVLLASGHRGLRGLQERVVLQEPQELKVSKELKVRQVLQTVFLILLHVDTRLVLMPVMMTQQPLFIRIVLLLQTVVLSMVIVLARTTVGVVLMRICRIV